MKISTAIAAILFVVGADGLARAEVIGRLDCTLAGSVTPDAVGDQTGHYLLSWQYACTGVDGVIKGASYSGSAITDWSGAKGTWISGAGIIRAEGGLAVTQTLEGSGIMIMKDGKPTGADAAGKAIFKFASGTLAGLSGKTINWSDKPAPGVSRATLEWSD